jgi:hypothetical protein
MQSILKLDHERHRLYGMARKRWWALKLLTIPFAAFVTLAIILET